MSAASAPTLRIQYGSGAGCDGWGILFYLHLGVSVGDTMHTRHIHSRYVWVCVLCYELLLMLWHGMARRHCGFVVCYDDARTPHFSLLCILMGFWSVCRCIDSILYSIKYLFLLSTLFVDSRTLFMFECHIQYYDSCWVCGHLYLVMRRCHQVFGCLVDDDAYTPSIIFSSIMILIRVDYFVWFGGDAF